MDNSYNSSTGGIGSMSSCNSVGGSSTSGMCGISCHFSIDVLRL